MKRFALVLVALLLLPSPAHAASPEPPFAPPDGWLLLTYDLPSQASDFRFHKWLYATYYPGDLVAETAASVRAAEWRACRMFQLDSERFLERTGTGWQLAYYCGRGMDEIAVMWRLTGQGESLMLVYSTAVGDAPPAVPTILETGRGTGGEMETEASTVIGSDEAVVPSAQPRAQDSILADWTNPLWLLIPGAAATILYREARRRRIGSEVEAPAPAGPRVRVASESAVPPSAP